MHSKCSILLQTVHAAVFAVPGSEQHIKTLAAMQPRARQHTPGQPVPSVSVNDPNPVNPNVTCI